MLAKEPDREPGSRTRHEYRLTPAGEELRFVLGTLQQWGDQHLPWHDGPTSSGATAATIDPSKSITRPTLTPRRPGPR